MSGREDAPVALSILKLLQAARQSYGLRTNDYARYHAHCVRRVRALHVATKTTNRNARRKGKTASSTSSSNLVFKSTTAAVDAASAQKDPRLLELLLWESERAWAEGMRAREELAALERAKVSSAKSTTQPALAAKRHRANRRLARGAHHAEKLVNLLSQLRSGKVESGQSGILAGTLLQAHIYQLYISGTHSFALASSSSAAPVDVADSASTGKSALPPAQRGAQSLSTAYVLLESFAQRSRSATDEALAFEFLDELEPMIRFCAYKTVGSSESSAKSVADTARGIGKPVIEAESGSQEYASVLMAYEDEESSRSGRSKGAPKHASDAIVKNIQWRDIDVPIRSAELANALGNVQAALSRLRAGSSTRGKAGKRGSQGDTAGKLRMGSLAVASYDRSLASLSEADEKARKLVEDNAAALSRAHSVRFEAATKPLAIAHSYIRFQLLSLRAQRDQILLSTSLEKHRARGAARESKGKGRDILHNRRQAKSLPIFIKLLDGILQSLEQIRELDIVEDDSMDLAGVVDARIAFEKARRCLFVGQVYALVSKFPESITLYQRSALYLRQARGTATEAEDGTGGVECLLLKNREIPSFENDLSIAQAHAEKDWFLHSEATSDVDNTFSSLSLGRQAGKASGPKFFDIAFSYIAGIDTESLGKPPIAEDVNMEPAFEDAVDHADDTQVQQVAPVAESVPEDAPLPVASTKSAGGIWGLFGRGRK